MELHTKFEHAPKAFEHKYWCIKKGCATEIFGIETNLKTNDKKYIEWNQDCDNHFKLSTNPYYDKWGSGQKPDHLERVNANEWTQTNADGTKLTWKKEQ